MSFVKAFACILFGVTIVAAASEAATAQDPEWQPALILSEFQECIATNFCLPERLGQEWQSEMNRIRVGIDSCKSKDALVRDLNSVLGLLKMSKTKLLSLAAFEIS